MKMSAVGANFLLCFLNITHLLMHEKQKQQKIYTYDKKNVCVYLLFSF